LIAAVALEDNVFPSPAEVVQFLQEHWPNIATAAESQSKPGVMTFSMDGDRAGMALVAKPLPWSDLEGPCAAAWYWPQAAAAFRRHAAHLIATVMPEGRDRLATALRLTAMVAASGATSHALGVYWGPGRLVHAPEAFLQESLHMSRENLPLNLWVDFRLGQNEDGTHSLFTTGLAAFGYREMEIWDSRRSPQSLRDSAYNVAHYVLEKGSVLKQGETIGGTEEEKIPIRVEPSRWDGATTVIRLDI
jgi:hypothetical protein